MTLLNQTAHLSLPASCKTDWIVFKGGSAFNYYLKEFQKQFPSTAYIVPITDDGGSSREIGRVFGGPSIGDLRSTLTRLSDESTVEACAVKKILEHRLPNEDLGKAVAEWRAFLEDRHPLYLPLTSKYKGLIRSFLSKFETERLQRIGCGFDMRNGSIGNFFFSGARMVLGTLETAIFMYSSVAQISPLTHVLPIIDSNERLGIAVNLANNEQIFGQNLISHPRSLKFDSLASPITKLFYVDKFSNQILPDPHPEVIAHLRSARGVIYGVGSFWTSIVPSLIVKGMGEAIASINCPKIALLNCCYDRETEGMSALDCIVRLTESLNRYGVLSHPPKAYLTNLFVVSGSEISIDEDAIHKLGILIHYIPPDQQNSYEARGNAHPLYSTNALIQALKKIKADGNL